MAKSGANLTFAVVKIGLRRFGLIVDRVIGTEEIVVKPMHPTLKGLRCCGGATVMGDGQVALILDIEGIAHVINFEVPDSPDTYVHRVGRTGRSGASGHAVTLVSPNEQRNWSAVEAAIGFRAR